MKPVLLATLSCVLLLQTAAYAAYQSPLTLVAPTPSIDQPLLLSEAQAGLSAWDITAYAAHPAELRTTTAQHFIDKEFAHFQELSPTISSNEFHDVRKALLAEDPTQDLGLPEKTQAFTEKLKKSKSGERLKAWLIGFLSGQIEDNAINLKNSQLSDQEIAAILPLNSLDVPFPAIHDLRFSLLTLRVFNPKVPDWQRIGITSHALRQIIGAAPTKDQTPIAGLIALNIPPDSSHLIDLGTAEIEFINADGSIKNMATYADTKSMIPNKSIHCGIDASPITPEVFFLPLVIGGSSKYNSASSFHGLVDSCEKIDGLQPAMDYQPGLVTPFSTMIGLLLMTDPLDGKIIMQHLKQKQPNEYTTSHEAFFR